MEDSTVCKVKKKCYGDDKRILCVVARKELYDMHIKNFSKEGIKLIPYRNKKQRIKTNDMCCSIDLINAYSKLTDEEMKKTVLYLSEPSYIIKVLMTNVEEQPCIRIIYNALMRLINNC